MNRELSCLEAARARRSREPRHQQDRSNNGRRAYVPGATVERVGGKVWSRIAAGGAIASLAAAAALQAGDGVALKVMVDTWTAAPPGQKESTFQAAFAVRQIEIGLASMVSLLFGLTANVYAQHC